MEESANYKLDYKVGDKVLIEGSDTVVAEIVGLRQFQNASDDNWYWCALLKCQRQEELQGYYPVKYLRHYRQGEKSGR